MNDTKHKLFILTNSGFDFLNAGMKHLIGNDWADLFNIVITSARKPEFFFDKTVPFRVSYLSRGMRSYDRVNEFKRGTFYEQGNLVDFRNITGWTGGRVLYCGDHIYSDLADAGTLLKIWRKKHLTFSQNDNFLVKSPDICPI